MDMRHRHSIRSLPDTHLARLLTAAYGRPVSCHAEPNGSHAVLALPSGACLFVRGDGDRLDIRVVGDGERNAALTLDGLAALRLDLEVLARAGELVELYVFGDLRPDHFDGALTSAEIGSDEEEVADWAMIEARSLDLDMGDGEVPAPGSCLVELALALRELLELAAEHAPEVSDDAQDGTVASC